MIYKFYYYFYSLRTPIFTTTRDYEMFLSFFNNVTTLHCKIFYWSHLLYIPFWILMIFHGPNFWKWFVGPGVIYLVERIRRLIWLRSQRGKTYISSGLLLPSKVTHLVIKRPPHFHFHPGDYVFVNVPVIAGYEWHPFTISSAPEQEGELFIPFIFHCSLIIDHYHSSVLL